MSREGVGMTHDHGAQWLPDGGQGSTTWQPGPADEVPHPASTSPFEPFRPTAEPEPRPRVAQQRPPRRVGWSVNRIVLLVLAIVLLAGVAGTAVLVVMMRGVAQTQQDQVERAGDVRVRTALITAGRAVETYAAEHGQFPTDLRALGDYGYLADPEVDVQVVRPGGPPAFEGFCLAATPVGQATTHWFEQGSGVRTEPC